MSRSRETRGRNGNLRRHLWSKNRPVVVGLIGDGEDKRLEAVGGTEDGSCGMPLLQIGTRFQAVKDIGANEEFPLEGLTGCIRFYGAAHCDGGGSLRPRIS